MSESRNYISKKSDLKIKKWRVSACLYGGSVVLLCLSLITAQFTNSSVHKTLLVFAFLLMCIGTLALCRCREIIKRNGLQLFLSVAPFILLWDTAAIFSENIKYNPIVVLSGVISLQSAFIILVLWVKSNINGIRRCIRGLISDKLFIATIAIFLLLSLESLSRWITLDSNIYFHYLERASKWDMTFSTIGVFRLGGHTCPGYTVFGLAGYYLDETTAIGVRVINIIMLCIAFGCLRSILLRLFGSNGLIFSDGAVACVAFNPLVLGQTYAINLDIPQLYFFIIVSWALLNNKSILFATYATFLSFCKETGIILLAGIGVGWILRKLINRDKIFEHKVGAWLTIGGFVTPAIMYAIVLASGRLWRQSTALSASSNSMDRFGISWANITSKLKEILILNFSWLYVAGILLLAVLLVLACRKKRAHINSWDGLPISVAILFYLAFQFAYITYTHSRYIIICTIGVILLFFALFAQFCSGYCSGANRRVVAACIGMLAGLSLVQTFITVDPVTLFAFRNVPIGDGVMVSTRTFVRSSENQAQVFEDNPSVFYDLSMTQSLEYNRQYAYFQDAFNEFLQQINYDDTKLLIIDPVFDNNAPGMTYVSLFGDWYSDSIHYNEDSLTVSMDKYMPEINYVMADNLSSECLDEYSEVYFITFPYNPNYAMRLPREYDIVNQFSVVEKQWRIDVYQIKV